MKYLVLYFTMFIILQCSSLYAATISTQESQPAIQIDNIIKNKHIEGYVSGLDSSEYDKYKVIVYVHTDKWYIHPYASGGKGKSYAKIQKDGYWKIKTKKREFPADEVAALIVEKTYKPKSMLYDIEDISCLNKCFHDTGYEEGDEDWDI